jgi:hypothetical protein
MMHRTVSLDYVIVTNGRMRMETDTGESVELGPGVRTPFFISTPFPLSPLSRRCFLTFFFNQMLWDVVNRSRMLLTTYV